MFIYMYTYIHMFPTHTNTCMYVSAHVPRVSSLPALLDDPTATRSGLKSALRRAEAAGVDYVYIHTYIYIQIDS